LTDPDLGLKKLARVETCVRELRTLSRLDDLEHDVREQRFVEHTLQIGIQAALDAASHVVSDARLGEPQTNRELFELLARGGRIDADLAERLGDMAGFRNVLVHGYATVDLRIVRDVVVLVLVVDDGSPGPAAPECAGLPPSDTVEIRIVRDVVENRLEDLLTYVAAMRTVLDEF